MYNAQREKEEMSPEDRELSKDGFDKNNPASQREGAEAPNSELVVEAINTPAPVSRLVGATLQTESKILYAL